MKRFLEQEPVARIPNNASIPIAPLEAEATESLEFRLPSFLSPKEYRIKIFPVPSGTSTFQGHVEIDFEVLEPTSVISLNAANLVFNETSFKVSLSCHSF